MSQRVKGIALQPLVLAMHERSAATNAPTVAKEYGTHRLAARLAAEYGGLDHQQAGVRGQIDVGIPDES